MTSAQDAFVLIATIIKICQVLATDPDFALPEVKRLGGRVTMRGGHWTRAMEKCKQDPDKLQIEAEHIKNESQRIVKALGELQKECDDNGGVVKALKKKVFHDKIVKKVNDIDAMINTMDLDMGRIEENIQQLNRAIETRDFFKKILEIVIYLENSMDTMRKRFKERPTWTLLEATFEGLVGVTWGALLGPTGAVAGGIGAGAIAHAMRMDSEEKREVLFMDLQTSMFNVEKLRLKTVQLQQEHPDQVMISTTDRLTSLRDELLQMMTTMNYTRAGEAQRVMGSITAKDVDQLWATFQKPIGKTKGCIIS